MAQKINDKKIEGPALKTVYGYLYHTYLTSWGELTVDRFECRYFFCFFYHEFFGPSRMIIHAQNIFLFMERMA